ncbi:MAG: hypothetical protein BGO10_09070 [Chlamydia sp. 32-24]|nr:MAG: hypothetical protein BGO10_09070 [Chlamydia sp. 32-24]
MQVPLSVISNFYLNSYKRPQDNKPQGDLGEVCPYFTTLQEDENIILFQKLGIIEFNGHIKDEVLRQLQLPYLDGKSILEEHAKFFPLKGFYDQEFPLNISFSLKELFTILYKEFPNTHITYGGSSLFDHIFLDYIKECFTLFFKVINYQGSIEQILTPYLHGLLIEHNRDQDFSILPPEPYPIHASFIAKRITSFLAERIDQKTFDETKLIDHLKKKSIKSLDIENCNIFEELIDNSGFCKYENPNPNADDFKNCSYIRSLSDRKITPLIIDLFIMGRSSSIKGLNASNALYLEIDDLYNKNDLCLILRNDLCHPFQGLFDNVTQLMTTYDLPCKSSNEFLRYINELTFLKRSWEEGLFRKLFTVTIKEWEGKFEQCAAENAFKQNKTHYHCELNQLIGWTFTFCSYLLAYDKKLAYSIFSIWQNLFAIIDIKQKVLKRDDSVSWINFLQIALRSSCNFEELLALFQVGAFISVQANFSITNHSTHITQTDHPGFEKITPTYQIRVYPTLNHKIFAFVFPQNLDTLYDLFKISNEHLSLYDKIFTDLLPLELSFDKNNSLLKNHKIPTLSLPLIYQFLDHSNFLLKKIGYYLALLFLLQNEDNKLVWRLIEDCYLEKKLASTQFTRVYKDVDNFFLQNIFQNSNLKVSSIKNVLDILLALIDSVPQLHVYIIKYFKNQFLDKNLLTIEDCTKIYHSLASQHLDSAMQWANHLITSSFGMGNLVSFLATIHPTSQILIYSLTWILENIKSEDLENTNIKIENDLFAKTIISFLEKQDFIHLININQCFLFLLFCQKIQLIENKTVLNFLKSHITKPFILDSNINTLLELWLHLKTREFWPLIEKEIKLGLLEKLSKARVKKEIPINLDELLTQLSFIDEQVIVKELYLIHLIDPSKGKEILKSENIKRVFSRFGYVDDNEVLNNIFLIIKLLLADCTKNEQKKFINIILFSFKSSFPQYYIFHLNFIFYLWHLIKKDNELISYSSLFSSIQSFVQTYPEKQEDAIRKTSIILSSIVKHKDSTFVFAILNCKELQISFFHQTIFYNDLIDFLKRNTDYFFEQTVDYTNTILKTSSKNVLELNLDICLHLLSRLPKKISIKKIEIIIHFFIDNYPIVKELKNHQIKIETFLKSLSHTINKDSIHYYNLTWQTFHIPFEIEWMERAQNYLEKKICSQTYDLAIDLLSYSPIVNLHLLYKLVQNSKNNNSLERFLSVLLKFKREQFIHFDEEKYQKCWEIIFKGYKKLNSNSLLDSFLKKEVFYDIYRSLNSENRLKASIVLVNTFILSHNKYTNKDAILLYNLIIEFFLENNLFLSFTNKLTYLANIKLKQLSGFNDDPSTFKKFITYFIQNLESLFVKKKEWKSFAKITLSNPLFWEEEYVKEQIILLDFILQNIYTPFSELIKTEGAISDKLAEKLKTLLSRAIDSHEPKYSELKEIFTPFGQTNLTNKLIQFIEILVESKKSANCSSYSFLKSFFFKIEEIYDFLLRGNDILKIFLLKTIIKLPLDQKLERLSLYLTNRILENSKNLSKMQFLKDSLFLNKLPQKEQTRIKKILVKSIFIKDDNKKIIIIKTLYNLTTLFSIAALLITYLKGENPVIIFASFGFVNTISLLCLWIVKFLL